MFAPNTKILIVDDSVLMRSFLTTALKKLGFNKIVDAENGLLGFRKVEIAAKTPEPVELIFSDHNMPECTGLEFLLKLKAVPAFAKIPFVVVTSENSKDVILELLHAGAHSYITKPFTPEDLQKRMQTAYLRTKKSS